jgi:hypothetical protein
MKPSDFAKIAPMDSVCQEYESEDIKQNGKNVIVKPIPHLMLWGEDEPEQSPDKNYFDEAQEIPYPESRVPGPVLKKGKVLME